MATILLPVVAESIAATAAAGATGIAASSFSLTALSSAALTAAGGLVDQSVIFPRLFKQQPQEGPRLGDLQLADTTEGSPIFRCFGEMVRVPGIPIWNGGIQEVKDTTKGGGKGGTGGTFITYKAFVDAGFLISAGPIGAIEKVWADGKVFWENRASVDETSTLITASLENFQLFGASVQTTLLVLDTTSSGPDLSLLQSGQDVVLSGYPNSPSETEGSTSANIASGSSTISVDMRTGSSYSSGDTIRIAGHPAIYEITSGGSYTAPATVVFNVKPNTISNIANDTELVVRFGSGTRNNDGTWEVYASSRNESTGASQVKLVHRYLPDYNFKASSAGDSIRIQQKAADATKYVDRISFQLGDDDQEPDEVLVDRETANVGDAAQVYGGRGRAYMWLEQFELTDFGNRIPNFEFLARSNEDGDNTNATAIKRIATAASNVTEDDVDVSGVTGNLRGYASRGPQAPRDDLGPIMFAHSIVARDVEGVLTFTDRASLPVTAADADDDDLAAEGSGSTAPRPFRVSEPDDQGVPTEIHLSYVDPDNDYQTGSRKTPQDPEAINVDRVTVPVVLSRDEAQQLAEQLIAVAANRYRYQGTLSPRLVSLLNEGEILRVSNAMGETHDILVTRLERGANGVVAFEGFREDSEALDQSHVSAESSPLNRVAGAGNENNGAPGTVWHAMDIPALRDSDRNQPGFYLAAQSAQPDKVAHGFVVYSSTDGGVSFGEIARVPRNAVFGNATTAPSSSGISHLYIDRATTLRVELHDSDHELEGVTLQEMAKGRNRFLWGNEIIGASTVTLVSTGVYDLSVLQRGLLDTSDEMTNHAVGDRVVWLDGPGIEFVPLNHAALGGERQVKVVAHGGDVGDASWRPVTITGRNIKPPRVVQVAGTRNGSNDLTVTWSRQSRAIVQTFDQATPLDEEAEEYRIRILDAPGGDEVAVYDNLTDTSWTYTAAMQTTDGLTPGDPVDLEIAQRSTALHIGRTREETL